MELIIRTYGKFLLEAFVFVSFWLLVLVGVRDSNGNTGFFQILGSCFDEEQVAYGADFLVCVEESMRTAPEIFCKKKSSLGVGIYDVSEIVGATDCEGNELMVEVLEVHNTQGIFDMQIYDSDTRQIIMEVPGIYTLQVSAVDCWNGTSVCRISIPVN